MSVKDLYRRIAALPPEKRALLGRKLEGTDSPEPPEPTSSKSSEAELAVPVSLMQRRLWLVDRLEPGNLAYSLPILAFYLDGLLRPRPLQRLFDEIYRRHESLRTTFREIDGEAHQIIHPPTRRHPLPVIDLSRLDEATTERESVLLARREGRRPFDLIEGPLWRHFLIRQHSRQHLLIVLMHHIISDGWSLAVMYREIMAIYGAYARNQPSPLPELSFQYRDFADWQRRWLSGERLERELDFWRRQLDGANMNLELPTDRPRPAVQTVNGHRVTRNVPKGLAEALPAALQRFDTTLFMFLLALFKTLVYRLTGQRDLLAGTPFAGRDLPGSDGLIGFLVNTLVLRVRVAPDLPFETLLQRVRAEVLEVYDHRNLPFDRLVEEVQPQRDLSYPPVFQVMFTVQNVPIPELELPDLEVREAEVQNLASQDDLTCFVSVDPDDGSYTFNQIEYNTDLFDATTVQRWQRNFEVLLAAALSDPARPLAALPLLAVEERHQLLWEWSRPAEDSSLDAAPTLAGAPRADWADRLVAQAARRPDAIAVVQLRHHLSYGALAARSGRLAAALQQRGCGVESRVALYLPRSLGMITALVGVLRAGAAYLPLDPGLPRARVETVLDEARPTLLLGPPWLHNRLPAEAPPLVDPLPLEALDATASPAPRATAGTKPRQRLAAVLYTSGSTGRPKGVQVPIAALAEYCDEVAQLWHLGTDDRVLQFAALSFDTSAEEIFPALLSGATLVLRGEETAADSERFNRSCERWGITLLDLPTAWWHTLTAAPGWRPPPAVRRLVIGGEAAAPDRLAAWRRLGARVPLINTYGPSEGTIVATRATLGSRSSRYGRIPIGHPAPGSHTYVADARQQLVVTGVAGELLLGGTRLARGYLGQPRWTAEAFIPDGFDETRGARLYRTGDLVRQRPDGVLDFVGRTDHQIKLRGYRIEPAEIEAMLSEQPGVRRAVVIVHRDQENAATARLIAYLIADDGGLPASQRLRDALAARLPGYMVPAAFVEIDEIPLTSHGKLDRDRLPAAPSQRLDAEGRAPRTPLEQAVAPLFAEVLGLASVRAEDNFFALGGHSLSATQVIARLRATFGVELPLRQLFEHPTVAGLATALDALLRTADMGAAPGGAGLGGQDLEAPPRPSGLDTHDPTVRLPLSHGQMRLWLLARLDPTSAAYNMPLALSLTQDAGTARLDSASLDIASLHRALNTIEARHSVLRSRFYEGRSTQSSSDPDASHDAAWTCIQPLRWRALPMIDLQALAAADRAATTDQLVSREGMQPFDLEAHPPWRWRLLRLAASEHVLLLTLHHAVSDGWSLDVLLHELAVLYGAASLAHQNAAMDATTHLDTAGRDPVSSALPPLRLQYADYAAWQRQHLHGQVLERLLGFWRGQLADAPPVLELPLDRPRPRRRSGHGKLVPVPVSPGLRRPLERLASRTGTTLFMVLAAAMAQLLGRHAGRRMPCRDVVLGTPVAGRRQVETEALIGFFVNTLALRMRWQPQDDLDTLLASVRRTALDAYSHQDLPFEQLVEAVNPTRDLSHSPIFQVSFSLQSTAATLEGGGIDRPATFTSAGHGALTVQPFTAHSRASEIHTARWDLEIIAWTSEAGAGDATSSTPTTDGKLGGAILFDADLFDATTVQRLARCWAVLLDAWAEAAAGAATGAAPRPAEAVSLLHPAERHQLCFEWSDAPALPWMTLAPESPTPQTLPDRFAAIARQYLDAVAVHDRRHHLSYGELRRRGQALALHLLRRSRGTNLADQPIGLGLPAGLDTAIAMLGILSAGGAYVPLDPEYPTARLQAILEDCRPTLLITRGDLAGHFPATVAAGAELVLLDQLHESAGTSSSGASPSRPSSSGVNRALPAVHLDQLAYVIYTSGSTGRPKGVQIPHRGVAQLLRPVPAPPRRPAWARFGPPLPDDRVAQLSSPSFDAATLEQWGALLGGGTLVVVDRHRLLTAPDQVLTRRGISYTLIITPALLQLASRQADSQNRPLRHALGSVRRVLYGGEAGDPEPLRRLLESHRGPGALLHMYGPTEATVYTAGSWVGGRGRTPAQLDHATALGLPLGRPLDGTRLLLLDTQLQPLPAGVAGELCAGGDHLARGYLGQPGQTATVFVPDAWSATPGCRLYRTGDLARTLPDGRVCYLGRIDHQVKLRGYRIELGEVRAALEQHPRVAEAAVLVHQLPTTQGGATASETARLVAYVAGEAEAPSGARPDAGTLRSYLLERLPPYMVPSFIQVLDVLPRTPSGKVDLTQLHSDRLEVNNGTGTNSVPTTETAPTDPIEQILAEAWADLLALPQSRRDAHFFELGGHSLLATRALARLRQMLGVEIPLRDVFEHPTPAALAPRVRALLAAGNGNDTGTPVAPPTHQPRAPTRAGTCVFPTSFGQRRLWLLERLGLGGAAYHMPAALRLRGRLDVDALTQAFSTIVERHEILRTGYRDGNSPTPGSSAPGSSDPGSSDPGSSDPVQVIHPARPVQVPCIDLQALAAPDRDTLTRQLNTLEARRPFDLGKPPLLRLLLLRHADDDHLLSLTLHHIASDGWSIGVLVRELGALMRVTSRRRTLLRTGSPPAPLLADLPLQYADFAVWQRQRLDGPVLQAEVDWWRRCLCGPEDRLPPPLLLPTDLPRRATAPQRQERPEGRVQARLDADLVQRLSALGQRAGATPFMVLLAAFQVLLSRLSGQERFAVGTPIAGRTHAELEPLIGFFANTLALPADLHLDSDSFDDLMSRLRETVLGAYSHQELPFEALVEALNPPRDLQRTPLFQVFFNLVNLEASSLELPGLQLTPEPVDDGVAKFDLTLYLQEAAQQQGHRTPDAALHLDLHLDLHYDAGLFDPASVSALLQRYSTLLDGLVSNPQQRVDTLPLLPPSDQAQALQGDRWPEPALLAARLREHPAVAEAAVVPIESAVVPIESAVVPIESRVESEPERHVDLDAFLVARSVELPGARVQLDLEALRRDLLARLPELRQLHAVEALPYLQAEIPRLDVEALRASLRAAESEPSTPAPPRGPIEVPLAALWSTLLDVPQVKRGDDFFDLGGHSLLAGRLLAGIRERLGVEISLRAVFEHPTLHALAAHVEQELARQDASHAADLEALLAEVEDLADDEVERRLRHS